MYLKSFTIPSLDQQDTFLAGLKRTCYNDFYPFRIFDHDQPQQIYFAPVTMLYGNNGSGKTTLLNLIAETLKIKRGTVYNRSSFFSDYVDLCGYALTPSCGSVLPEGSQIMTSDDVFDYLINLRQLNEGIDQERDALLEEHVVLKYNQFRFRSMEDYDQLKKVVDAQRKSGSKYVKARLMNNVREQSNGESAFMYFTQEIKENSLYLLDEPENSLSAELQVKLLDFIQDSIRFYGCQFIISTHSPFMLSLRDALIYDLDEKPMLEKRWTELHNVRVYYDFFKEHQHEFER